MIEKVIEFSARNRFLVLLLIGVAAEDYLGLALTLVTEEHVAELQEESLSNTDRLERDYREYVTQHGSISKDEYLGKRLSGEIAAKTAAH
jgi:hypothetical protein